MGCVPFDFDLFSAQPANQPFKWLGWGDRLPQTETALSDIPTPTTWLFVERFVTMAT